LNLFYHPTINCTTTQIKFDKEESRHISKVLRKQMGDTIQLTNGKGFFFTATISDNSLKKAAATIISYREQPSLPYQLHLAVAPTKLNDRYEWFLEKATEIGVSEITPIICEHSERKIIKTERYNKIIQSAMKQSFKAHLPILHPPISLNEFLSKTKKISNKKYIAHCKEIEKTNLKEQLRPKENCIIIIGPEGDFSSNEIEKARNNNFAPITLGGSRLRTETAAIVACHSVSFINA